MELIKKWIQEFKNFGLPSFEVLTDFLPNLFGAALILAIGWFVSGLFRNGTIRLCEFINRVLNVFLSRGGFTGFSLSRPVLTLFSKVIFWAAFLFFLKFAAHVLRLEVITGWLDDVVDYLPTFLAGGIIIGAGILFSVLARDLTSAAADSAHLPQNRLYGVAAQVATLVTTVMIGLNQIGIDVSFLANMIAVVVGTLLGSLALAFGLGSKTFVSNLIGSHYLQQQYQPGQRVRMGKEKGTILEISPSAVILATEEGRLTIPAKVFNEDSTCLILLGDDPDE